MADEAPQSESPDVVVRLTDRFESAVAAVRDKTTIPVIKAAQAVVFGVVAGVLGAVVVFLLVLVVVRLLIVYLPFGPHGRRVWIVDAIASAIFLGSGMFLWRKRGPTPS